MRRFFRLLGLSAERGDIRLFSRETPLWVWIVFALAVVGVGLLIHVAF